MHSSIVSFTTTILGLEQMDSIDSILWAASTYTDERDHSSWHPSDATTVCSDDSMECVRPAPRRGGPPPLEYVYTDRAEYADDADDDDQHAADDDSHLSSVLLPASPRVLDLRPGVDGTVSPAPFGWACFLLDGIEEAANAPDDDFDARVDFPGITVWMCQRRNEVDDE